MQHMKHNGIDACVFVLHASDLFRMIIFINQPQECLL